MRELNRCQISFLLLRDKGDSNSEGPCTPDAYFLCKSLVHIFIYIFFNLLFSNSSFQTSSIKALAHQTHVFDILYYYIYHIFNIILIFHIFSLFSKLELITSSSILWCVNTWTDNQHMKSLTLVWKINIITCFFNISKKKKVPVNVAYFSDWRRKRFLCSESCFTQRHWIMWFRSACVTHSAAADMKSILSLLLSWTQCEWFGNYVACGINDSVLSHHTECSMCSQWSAVIQVGEALIMCKDESLQGGDMWSVLFINTWSSSLCMVVIMNHTANTPQEIIVNVFTHQFVLFIHLFFVNRFALLWEHGWLCNRCVGF